MTMGLLTRARRLQQTQPALPIPTVPSTPAPQIHTQHTWIFRRSNQHLAEVEQAFLTLLSAFHTPVRHATLKKMFNMVEQTPTVPRAALGQQAFKELCAHLTATRALQYNADRKTYALHPLVRAHYRAHLEASSRPELSHIARPTQDYDPAYATPTSLPAVHDIPALIEAVYHACRVGAYDAACKIYLGRIQQTQHSLLTYSLGTYEVNLMLLAEFFPNGDTKQAPEVADQQQQSWILNEIGLCLTELGRLREAEPFYKRALDQALDERHWHNASIVSQNLAHLYYYMGNLNTGSNIASEALMLTRLIQNRQLERDALIYGARSAFLYGDLAIAGKAFQRAKAITRDLDPARPQLYGLHGIWYAEYLYRAGNIAAAQQQTESNLENWAIAHGLRHDESRCHRLLGDIAGLHAQPSNTMGTGLLGMPTNGPFSERQARGHYNKALWIAQGSAHIPTLIEALLARGHWAARQTLTTAVLRHQLFDDLETALRYAVTGNYRCYEADIHVALAWAHLTLNRAPTPDMPENLHNPQTHQHIARQEAQRARALSSSINYHWGIVGADEVLAAVPES